MPRISGIGLEDLGRGRGRWYAYLKHECEKLHCVVESWLYAPWLVNYDRETRMGDFQEQTWQFADVCEPQLKRPLRVNDHALVPLSDNLVDDLFQQFPWWI